MDEIFKLRWHETPYRRAYGDDMMEAILPVGNDEIVTIVAHRSVIDKIPEILKKVS
jgi:hypothetical protein